MEGDIMKKFMTYDEIDKAKELSCKCIRECRQQGIEDFKTIEDKSIDSLITAGYDKIFSIDLIQSLLRMANYSWIYNKYAPHKENAVSILTDMFKAVYEKVGLEWTEENETEVKNAVDYIMKADQQTMMMRLGGI
jgi:ribonuclease HIII